MLVSYLRHDGHKCPLPVADGWLRAWLPPLMSGPDYRAGRLAIIITADEDDRTAGNRVLTVVVHPQLRQRVVTTPPTHYSLLTGFYDAVLGAPALGAAATASSFGPRSGSTAPRRAAPVAVRPSDRDAPPPVIHKGSGRAVPSCWPEICPSSWVRAQTGPRRSRRLRAA